VPKSDKLVRFEVLATVTMKNIYAVFCDARLCLCFKIEYGSKPTLQEAEVCLNQSILTCESSSLDGDYAD
jgi:hypothetical protein